MTVTLPSFCYLQEQVEWAVEEGADFIIGETFAFYGEAQLALDAILQYGGGKTILILSFRTRLTAVPIPGTVKRNFYEYRMNY